MKRLLLSFKFLLVVYAAITIAASVFQYTKAKPGDPFTKYNNYLIFRQSFPHLVHGIDLYVPHEPEHFDLYKYSPGFAVFMAPFSWLPDLPGVIIWNLINALLLFYGIVSLPSLNQKAKAFILWFILIELLTNIQNCQSNGLIAGLLVWGLIHLEKKNYWLASLLIVFCGYIKIFGIAALLLGMLYPERIRFAVYSLLWMLVLTFIPLLFTTPDLLFMQYLSWYNMLSHDHALNYGISVFGMLHSWLQSDLNKNLILLAGLILLLIPFLFIKRYKEFDFRVSLFASLMIWLLIFNHRAESPTYIVAVTGIAIWFFSETRNRMDTALMCFVFVLTILSPTDLFPRSLRNDLIIPFSLKALPCAAVWLRINYRLIFRYKNLNQESLNRG